MFKCTKRTIRKQINLLRQSFFQIDGLPLNNILPEKQLKQLAEEAGNYRDKIFSPLETLRAFLWQVLSDNGSCKEAVANVLVERVKQGQSANSMNTGPYCKARQRLPLSLLENTTKETGKSLHHKANTSWKWHDYNIVMADGTTVLMADTEENQLEFPQQSAQKAGLGFPIARIVGLVSLSTGSLIDYAISAYQGKGNGESSLLSRILTTLKPGDLLLADRYYCTYAIVALMSHQDVPVLFKNHAKKKADFRQGTKLGSKDHLIYWEKPKRKPTWMSESDFKKLPQFLRVRELSVNGEVYVTTLLDHRQYSKKEIARLYQQRWKIELDLRTIKTDMKMEMLRCKTPEMVKKEIAVHFLAYNLIRSAIAQSAIQANATPRSISFKAAAQLLNGAMKQMVEGTKNRLIEFCKAILKAVSSTKIGLRKRQPQPRAVKRRPKPFPLLTVPREIACEALRK